MLQGFFKSATTNSNRAGRDEQESSKSTVVDPNSAELP
jgi:hypothetical protein